MELPPEVLPPAFFPIGLNVAGRRCVVIGPADDREAVEKARDLAEAGADVVRITDPAALRDADLDGAFFVISTPQDAALSARLRALAERERFLLCAIDQPAYGLVALQAVVKSGPARIAISTGGVAPRVGGVLKEALQGALDARFARFLARLAHLRRETRAAHPDDSAARRSAMLGAAEGFAVEVRVRYPTWFEGGAAGDPPQVERD